MTPTNETRPTARTADRRRTQMQDEPTTSVKMRPPNDPAIQAEVRSLIARMREPGFLGDLAHELVNLRAENAAMRVQLGDVRDADATANVLPDAYPQGVNPLIFDVNDAKHREAWDRAMQSGSRFGGFDANGSEVEA